MCELSELNIKAVSLGFIPKNLYIGWKENSYLWMCELQRWLREIHKIHIDITYHGEHKDGHSAFRCSVKTPIEESWNWNSYEIESNISGDFYILRSYEAALELALQKALKLIK